MCVLKTKASKQAFLKGTMILTVSGIIVKIIGALNWVVLARIIGGDGIGLYQIGFPIYLMAITISSAGIPVAISLLISRKLAEKDYLGAQRIFHVTLVFLLCLGLLFSVSIIFGAKFLIAANLVRDHRAYYSIVALAPAVIFVALLAGFRGYFQGWQVMAPTACSEVVEQLARVITMIVFSYLLLPRGIAYAAGGASMGAGVGAILGLLTLLYFYKQQNYKVRIKIQQNQISTPVESIVTILQKIIKIALPITLANLMLPIVANLDVLIVPTRLGVAGYSIEEATTLFGYLSGVAIPLINVATIFTAAMAVNLVPAISSSMVLGKVEDIRSKIRTAFKITIMITIPCCVGLYFLGEYVATIIYNAPQAAPIIKNISLGVIFLGLHQTSTGVLQGMGYTKIPVINMAVAAVCKIVLNWTLIARPTIGICGAAFATVADFGVAAVLNMFFIYKYMK